METFFQQIVNGLVLGSMYALVALGYTMVYGVLNLINFAHGDVMMIGAMVGLTILKVLQIVAPGLHGVVQLTIAIIGAIPVCVALNIVIERIAYRRLRNAPRLAPLITAIGVSILLQTIAMMIWGRNPIIVPQVMPSEPFNIAGVRISATQVMLFVLAIVSMCALVWLVQKTKLGRAMRATAENPRVAGLMGVNSNHVIVMTFAIGAALAAVTGVMWGALYSTVHFTSG
jgi:branched-chain amino acid transport system permease protein